MAKTKGASSGQSGRFVEAARKLGTNESEEAFNQALRKVAKAPSAPMNKPKKRKLPTVRR